MTYKNYAKKSDTPQRMARKHARATTFLHNARLAKAARKARRLARKTQQEEQAE